MRQLLYVDLSSRSLASTATGSAFTFPKIIAGQDLTLGFRFLETIDGVRAETDLPIAVLRASFGAIDRRPDTGTLRLKIGGDASSGTNTTAAFDASVDAAALADKLNALSARPSNFLVRKVDGSWLITMESGAQIEITVLHNKLVPVSFGRVSAVQIDGVWQHELRLIQTPLAFTDTAARVLPKAPFITTVRDGGADPSGVYLWNEIQRLDWPLDFRGLIQLRRSYARTILLSSADGAAEIAAALNAILAPENASALVTNPDDGYFHIEFQGDLGGIDVDPLEVTVFSAPAGDWTLTLPLDTADLRAALRTLPELVGIPFELEADLWIDPTDHEQGTRTVKLVQTTATIRRPLIWPELATVQRIDWQRPPSPLDYQPFTPDQVITGQQHYSVAIGDGAATSFVIDHNLDTDAIASVAVRENAAGGHPVTPASITFASSNSLTITFAEPPDAASLLVIITAAGPTSAFQDHTHPPQKVVAGGGYPSLVDFMDDIGNRVTVLEDILPSTGPAATPTSQASGIKIALPPTQEALFFKGDAKIFAADGAIDPSLLDRPPLMLPACHKSSSIDVTGDLPAAAGNAGKVYTNGTGAIVNLGRGPHGGKVADAGFFASDGRILFAATRSGSTTSYYPTAFERELWRIFINDKQLVLNRTLDVQFGLALQLLAATSNAQWVLVIEKGTAPQDSTPSTPGANLQNIVWDADPILSQRLILTGLQETHSFGVRIKRSLVATVDTLTLDEMLYGIWSGNNSAAPDSANFALRARLINFDTENTLAADARGWVTYQIIGAAEGGKPSAVIS